jgi:flagellar L-ring protein precursor FlgH
MRSPLSVLIGAALFSLAPNSTLAKQPPKQELSPLDCYVEEAAARGAARHAGPGSLYSETGLFGDLGRDFRAARVDDMVTIVVSDRASALARGSTNTNRKSSAKASVGSLAGPTRIGGVLSDLAKLDGEQQLQGQGETSRETSLTTTLSARITHVLPNGYLVVEGAKSVMINSERQLVTIRGVARWNDVSSGNTLRSDRLANLEVRVQGKGVVGDAIRRPNFLYRLLLGILPF